MLNISKLLSALWGLLALAAVAVLFFTYTNFPQEFQWVLPKPVGGLYLTKQSFFYFSGGIFLLVNLMLYAALKATHAYHRIAPGKLDATRHLMILVGVNILACGANFFLLVFMVLLKLATGDEHSGSQAQSILFMGGPVIMIMGLFYVFYAILKPPRETHKLH